MFAHYGFGYEVIMPAFPATIKVGVKPSVKEVFCCVTFPDQRFTELVIMVSVSDCVRSFKWLANQVGAWFAIDLWPSF